MQSDATQWRSIIPISLLWLAGCTTGTIAWDQASWIEVGKTTKAQVLDRYGEPDVAQKLADGTIATYFPALKFPPPPPTALPTIQTMQPSSAGFGIAMTNQIEPRLAVRDGARGPRQGLSIRYDAHDVVGAILEE